VTTLRVWQPVLYGRTRSVDRWWRVRPHQIDARWLDAVVTAGVAGGNELSGGPRFVLARRGPVLLVGAAARAAVLSETMNSDGSRPLYCFVGWLTGHPGATAPELDVLEASWASWAREVYEAWMPLDWDRHPSDLSEAHVPPMGYAPWGALSTSLPHGTTRGGFVPEAARRVTLPVAERARAWSDLLHTQNDFALAVGFSRSSIDTSSVFTHIVVADPGRDEQETRDAPAIRAGGGPPWEAREPVTRSPAASLSTDRWSAVPPERAPDYREPYHEPHTEPGAERPEERREGLLDKLWRRASWGQRDELKQDTEKRHVGPAGDLAYWTHAEVPAEPAPDPAHENLKPPRQASPPTKRQPER